MRSNSPHETPLLEEGIEGGNVVTATTEAQTHLGRVRAEKERAERELDELRAELAALETTAGEKILSARLNANQPAEAAVAAGLVAVRAKIEAEQRALAAAAAGIKRGERAVYTAEASDLRAEAAALWEKAAPRLAESGRLLDELFAFEGVRFIPPPVSQWGVFLDASMETTKTGTILREILDLERRAAPLEAAAGVTSPASILADVVDAWRHVGSPGTLRLGTQPVVLGSQISPTAPPSGFAGALRAELVAKGVQVRGS